LSIEVAATGVGEPVGASALLGWQRFDEPIPFEAGERSVQGAWSEAYTGKRVDVVLDRVAVLGSVTQADKREQSSIARDTFTVVRST
jgi:hypothetical protein